MDEIKETNKKQAKPRKLTRAERNDENKQRLFEAAAKVVGKYGYADASIARITSVAGLAQGTFYNHFENRQELLEKLLPVLGKGMLQFIRNLVDTSVSECEQEIQRFSAFFDFLHENPDFLRILTEAEHFANESYRLHMRHVTAGYARILRRAQKQGNGATQFSDDEIKAFVHILMGARHYLARQYAGGDNQWVLPESATSAYRKLLSKSFFG